jgi:hypothetical protein
MQAETKVYLNSLGKAVTTAKTKAQYDAAVKRLLAEPQILAWIIKWTMTEFYDMEPEDIIRYIDAPSVSSIPVDPGLTHAIEGGNTESKIQDEGLVTYDVRFYVINPKSRKKGEVRILVDIEAQRKPNPGYQLVPRGILYCGRMLSEQIDHNVKHGDYDALEKVYSIWLVFNCPSKSANTISSYAVTHNSVYGEFNDTERCDLLNVVMVRVPEDGRIDKAETKPSDLHELLYEVFAKKNSAEDKMRIMNQKFGLSTHMQEEVNVMCNLSEAVAEKAAAEATAEATEKATEKFSIAMNLYRSGERDKNVYRSEGVSEEVIAIVFGE